MRAFKTEILLTEKQCSKIINTHGVCRFLFNTYLAYNRENYEREKTFISGMEFDKYVNNVLSKEKEWIKDVSSKARKKAIMNAETAFKRFFNGQAKFPRFKKKNKQDVKAYFPKNNLGDLLVDRHRIKVPTLGWIRLKEKGYIPSGSLVSSCTIEQKGNRFFISVLVKNQEVKLIEPTLSPGKGIDLGLKDFAITSDGEVFKNINKSLRLIKKEKKLKREQRSLSRKYEHYKKNNNNVGEAATDKNLKKNILRVQKCHYSLTNARNAYQAFVIREVVKTKPQFITLEKLNVKGMMKNKHLSKAVQHQKFYEFKIKLLNKCRYLGIELREVSTFFPSSKLCSNCAHKKVSLPLSERIYHCEECGHKIDRDLNAAINLREAKKYTILT